MDNALVTRVCKAMLSFAEKLCREFSLFLQGINHRLTVKLVKQELCPLRTYNGEDILERLSFDEYRRLGHQIRNYERFIIRSAVALYNEDNEVISIYSVASPGHHAEVLFYMDSVGLNEEDLERTRQDSGFLDNHGVYVNRKEAMVIAKAAKQVFVNDDTVGDARLFSEQMWVLTDENPAFRKHYRFNMISYMASKLMRTANRIKFY